MIHPIKMLAGYAVLTATVVAAQVSYYKALPTSWWFAYHSVTILQPAPSGGPLAVQSVLNRWRTTNMVYHDTLFCDTFDGNGVRLYSEVSSSYEAAPPKQGVVVSKWAYTGGVPKKGQCYLRSATRAKGIFGLLTSPPDFKVSNTITIDNEE